MLTRRELLAAGAAAPFVPRTLPSVGTGLERAFLPGEISRRSNTIRDIAHVVVLLQENRSFDHLFGALRGVRGFADAGAGLPQGDGTGRVVRPWPMSPSDGCSGAPDHTWATLHRGWDRGRMDGFAAAQRAAGRDPGLAFGYWTRSALPYHYALADAFTVCDRFHASVLGPTFPNRLMAMTGTIDPAGVAGGPVTSDVAGRLHWRTYPERLEAAGISWQVYAPYDGIGDNVLTLFPAYADPSTALHRKGIAATPAQRLLEDAATGNLPEVSFVLAPEVQSEHAPAPPAAGAAFLAPLVDALTSSPRWSRTLLVVAYDEDGGYADHVAPPVPPPGEPGEWVGDEPIGLGLRVPALLVSPWSTGGHVCSDVFDHTSVLRLLEARFGVEAPLSAWRRRVCGDLTTALRFDAPDPRRPGLAVAAPATSALADCAARLLPGTATARSAVVPRQEPGTRPRVGRGVARPVPAAPQNPPAADPVPGAAARHSSGGAEWIPIGAGVAGAAVLGAVLLKCRRSDSSGCRRNREIRPNLAATTGGDVSVQD